MARLADEDLDGYILKKDSPSCGMERVKIHQPKGPPKRKGQGLFAQALLERFPNLPVEEEGRLCDPRLRENWVERVFAYHALKGLSETAVEDRRSCRLPHTLQIPAPFPLRDGISRNRRLVAQAKSLPRGQLRSQYQASFMSAMKKIATVKKNTNILQHMLGYFKKQLDGASRSELLAHIEDYRRGLVPLVVPLTLIRHYVRVLDVEYLRDQVYLNPHPKELRLRNHV